MPVKKYTKKPVTISAFQFDGTVDNLPEPFKGTDSYFIDDGSLFIKTLEGNLKASVGDYIIQGIKGEYYPCKPDIFEGSYDEAKKAPDYLEPHMQRVYWEMLDLRKRTYALMDYLDKGAPGATPDAVDDLNKQLSHMVGYLTVLKTRMYKVSASQETKFYGIYARSLNHVFGQGGKMPWPIPKEDMEHFLKKTRHKTVIMGRKTFESLGSKPLKDRFNIVVSSQYAGNPIQDEESKVFFAGSLDEAFMFCRRSWCEEVYVIGGAKLLEEVLPSLDGIYETVVHVDVPTDEETVTIDLNLDVPNDVWKLEDIQTFDWGRILTHTRLK